VLQVAKRLVVGVPLASAEERHQRLGRPTALAVFASDAISSTAYASEEILLVLTPVAGLAALGYLVPISVVVAALLVVVIVSYRQTIHAYPSGGGSYVVSRENLGVNASLVAGASLLVDYILTVAVSVSAGVAAITSAFPGLLPGRVAMCLGFVAVMTIANLRGLKESGRLFAGPTYVYVLSLGALLGWGLLRVWSGDLDPLPPDQASIDELTHNGALLGVVGPLLLLRAFSSGAVALTGIEAISNGVPAFRRPESRNASITLTWMGCILGGFFFGISVLAHHLQPTVSEDETLLSIMGTAVFGHGNPLYYVLQAATFAILILAANTAFADFPRVSSIIAADGFLPRQLANRGDRLVFSNGIIALGAVAATLIVAFGGQTSALIPLYAVGVFTGFTLSQLGMVRHHRKDRQHRWRWSAAINLVGAAATFLVLIVVVVSKFAIGAWIPAVLIPLIVLMFHGINRHYRRVERTLAAEGGFRPDHVRHTVVVLVGSVHRGTLDAITYARSFRPDRFLAVSVAEDDLVERQIREQWCRSVPDVALTVLRDEGLGMTRTVLQYVDAVAAESPSGRLSVVLPELVACHWWEQLLHNQTAMRLRRLLRKRPRTVIVAFPTRLAAPVDSDEALVAAHQ
jgi:amino acid transporter